jgi:hypothetical protein
LDLGLVLDRHEQIWQLGLESNRRQLLDFLDKFDFYVTDQEQDCLLIAVIKRINSETGANDRRTLLQHFLAADFEDYSEILERIISLGVPPEGKDGFTSSMDLCAGFGKPRSMEVLLWTDGSTMGSVEDARRLASYLIGYLKRKGVSYYLRQLCLIDLL